MANIADNAPSHPQFINSSSIGNNSLGSISSNGKSKEQQIIKALALMKHQQKI